MQQLPSGSGVPAPYAGPAATTLSGSPNTRYAEPESQQMVNSLAQTFRMRWRVFAAVALGFLALVVLFTLLVPKTYTSTVKLIAGNNATASTGGGGTKDPTTLPVLNALLIATGVQTSETYSELFQETPIAQSVIDNLHLNMSPEALLSRVKVKPVTNTNIMSVSATWSSPQMAAKVANEFASVFVVRERDLIANQATQAIDFLSKQLPAAEKRLRDSEARLSRFQAMHHIADVNAQTASTVAAAANIDAKINQVQLDQQQANAQIGSLSRQLASMSPTTSGGQTVAPNPVLGQLRAQLAQAEVQLKTAQQQYTDAHPTVIGLKSQVAQLQKQIAGQPATIVSGSNTVANPVYQQLSQQLAVARSQSSGDAAQLGQLTSQRSQVDPLLAALPAQLAQLANLQRQQKLSEAVYTALQQKYNDAMVTKTTTLSDVTITQPASPFDVTVRPNWQLNLAIGALLALILGLTAVFVVDFFDNSIKDDTEIERELNLPVLANVPQLPSSDRPATPQVAYMMTESFLQLVTSMRYASDKPLKTIAITSPLKGDGKSTIAINVGKALGELASSTTSQNGHAPTGSALVADSGRVAQRILLIDCDLRRPSLHQKLGLSNKRGLSDVLVGNARLAETVQSTRYPGLDVLSSGTPSPNPIKLLQSTRFDDLLAEASERYATVIIDAPALLPVFDAAVLSAKADGTILVVSAGQTDLRSTKRALQRLDQVGVRDFVGTVVNRSRQRVDEYSDYIGLVSGEGAQHRVEQPA